MHSRRAALGLAAAAMLGACGGSAAQGLGAACELAADCGGLAQPYCVDDACRECIQNLDCPGDATCGDDLRCE